MVKRYDCTSGGAQFCQGCYTMEEESDRVDGNWVRATDYDALAAELTKLKEARELGAKASATLRDESLAHQARVQALEAALGMNTPWPTMDILAKLIEATDHLLGTHGCDTHGHELFRAAAVAGKARLAASTSETDVAKHGP